MFVFMNSIGFRFVLICLQILLLFGNLQGATRIALSNGNWSVGGRWSGGILPTCGDSVIVPAGITVNVDNQLDFLGCGSTMKVNVKGTLSFNNGNKLRLPCNSRFYLGAAAVLNPGSGGGNSNFIEICSTVYWNAAMGTIYGPTCYPPSSACTSFLPVTLLYFTAKVSSENIELNWSTATEINNDYFTLERSSNGSDFYPIEKIKGSGNSTKTLLYKTYDQHPNAFINYYTLKQTDFNGKIQYSKIIFANFKDNNDFSIYPNPSNGSEFSISLSGLQNNEKILVVMEDITGRTIYSKVIFSGENGSLIEQIETDPSLPKGIYSVIGSTKNGIFKKKLIVN